MALINLFGARRRWAHGLFGVAAACCGASVQAGFETPAVGLSMASVLAADRPGWLAAGDDCEDEPGVAASPLASAASWEIRTVDRTLNGALGRWAASAGWQLLWEVPNDYAVEAETSIPGTFEQAVAAVTHNMAASDIPLKAIFYKGNHVLRIVVKGAE